MSGASATGFSLRVNGAIPASGTTTGFSLRVNGAIPASGTSGTAGDCAICGAIGALIDAALPGSDGRSQTCRTAAFTNSANVSKYGQRRWRDSSSPTAGNSEYFGSAAICWRACSESASASRM
jgi:hypothetical protein